MKWKAIIEVEIENELDDDDSYSSAKDAAKAFCKIKSLGIMLNGNKFTKFNLTENLETLPD